MIIRDNSLIFLYFVEEINWDENNKVYFFNFTIFGSR